MIDSNWSRWIFASATKKFQIVADDLTIPLYIEGIERLTKEDSSWLEFRLDGPNIREISKNCYRLDVAINILWAIHLDSGDFHAGRVIAGKLQEAMTCFEVRKYGDGPFDDGSLVGVLKLQQDKSNIIRSGDFGQLRPDTQITQGTVTGPFRMFL